VETTPTPVSSRLLSTTRRSRSGTRGNLFGTTSLRTTHDRRFNRLALAPAHMERVAAANVSQPARSQRPSLSGGPARGTLSRWAAVQFAGLKPTKGRPKGPTAPREGGRCQINRSSLHHPYPGTTPLESAHGSGLVGVGVGVGLREADGGYRGDAPKVQLWCRIGGPQHHRLQAFNVAISCAPACISLGVAIPTA
jgi:hypothetical protein